ncbi:TPA: ATP-dependent DNA helicase RecG [Candidatus Saccharibacteria bacterium]|nr:ATP-dependent DNA helicase RecG [Candidatus Saccharibacteria bacterium]HIO87427.1 ATP-dependent DNA helicase RecG [Candidatus Saccharibacteria bacterium]
MKLHTAVSELSGVGEATAKALKKLGIVTIGDLLFYIPRDYKDFSNLTTIKTMKPGVVSLQGQFTSVKARYARRGLHITTATFTDKSGEFPITWFNQSWRKDSLPINNNVLVSGELKLSGNKFSIINPAVELLSDVQLHTGRIVPVYKQSASLKTPKLRKLIHAALQTVNAGAYAPPALLNIDAMHQLEQIHFPNNQESLTNAITSWQFLDLYDQVLLGYLLRNRLKQLQSYRCDIADIKLKQFADTIGFTLTDAQRKAAWEIITDIKTESPMNRLLQGDVGSGKTVVALFAAYAALESGYQVAIVAPTEIVAKQHLESAQELLSDFKPKLLSSSLSVRQKTLIKNKLADGSQRIVVGTHALLQPDVSFKKLALVVLDEQHRFGVKQRTQLSRQDGSVPHVLSMTATPIPRTLALTVFADLDISVLDELPPGRKPVKTTVGGPRYRKQAYTTMSNELQKGHQVYVVCPLISESDVLGVTSVEQEVAKIKKQFPNNSVASLHGQLSTEDKDAIIDDFKAKNVDILVATTVVEVGVNIKNATVMLIEGAERFGLAQLHQLRGRVGRASTQAYAIALTTKTGQAADRLKSFVGTTNGFVLAEQDLQQRGSGDLYGLRQSGFIDLDIGVLSNTKLISKARSLAKKFTESYTVKDYELLQFRLDRIQHRAKRN